MSITTTGLTRTAAVAAMLGGAIFIAVQINHPPMEVATVTTTTDWLLRSLAKTLMSVLVLVGITGIFLRQRARSGWFGLVAYALFAVGYLAMLATEVIAATVLPALAVDQPEWVGDVLVAAAGGTATGDIGGVSGLLAVMGICYLLGGVTFGIAVLRAGVLAQWAASLLILGALGTAALAVLPESFNRPMAVVLGVALFGLGLSLWSSHGDPGVTTDASALDGQVRVVDGAGAGGGAAG